MNDYIFNEKVTDENDNGEIEIDLRQLFEKIWSRKKFIFMFLCVGLVVGVIVALSIPRQYTTRIVLAPEVGAGNAGSVNALATLAGLNTVNNNPRDALSLDLYPDIVKSTPFLTDISMVPVTDKEGRDYENVYLYLRDNQKSPWWSVILGFPRKIIGLIRGNGSEDNLDNHDSHSEGLRVISPENFRILESLSSKINVDIYQKTGKTSLSVTMQDPVISTIIADTLLGNLKAYITEYRTDKARQDLKFAEQLFEEAREKYYEAQQKLADFSDRNQNIVMQRFLAEKERLSNERNLTYGDYTQTAQQLSLARAKLQETTPVFTVIEPAMVPTKPSAPRRSMIVIAFLFISGVLGVGWVLFPRDFFRFRRQEEEESHEE